jgi:Na+/proline symporter
MATMNNKELQAAWKKLPYFERMGVSHMINGKAAIKEPISYIGAQVIGVAGLLYTMDRFQKADSIKDTKERRREKIACWLVGIGAGAIMGLAAIPYLKKVRELAVEYVQKNK